MRRGETVCEKQLLLHLTVISLKSRASSILCIPVINEGTATSGPLSSSAAVR